MFNSTHPCVNPSPLGPRETQQGLPREGVARENGSVRRSAKGLVLAATTNYAKS